jgi:hypothetical protein
MSEDNKSKNEEFDNFLNKKEKSGGAFDDTARESVEDVQAEETTSNKNKDLGSVNMQKFGQDKAESTDFVLGYHKVSMDSLFF